MRGDRETRNEDIKQVGGRRADRVRRRSVIARLAALLTAPERPSAQQSQGKIPRVGILTAEESERAPKLDAFRAGLRDLGYIEGRNIIVEFRFARGDLSRGAELAAELVSLPVDVIVIEGVPAAYDPNGHISIVSPVLIDPLERGFAVSLAHPGGNITGFTLMHAELNGKRLDLLRSAFAYNHRRRTGKSRKLKPQIGVRNRLKRLPGSLVWRVSAGSRPKASPPSASCVQPSSREPALWS